MRDLVFVVLLIGLLPVCLFRPWIGVLVWSWIAFMNPHRFTWSFAYTLPVAMMIGAATLIGLAITRDRKPIPRELEMLLLALLALHFTITTLFAMVPDSAWPKWDQTMKILLMTFVTTMLIYGRKRITVLLLVVALSVGFFGVKGALFTLRGGGMGQVRGPPSSFISDNNALALALIMTIPILLALGGQQQRPWARWGLYTAAALSGLATIFTYSRGGMLGLAAIVVVMLVQSKQKILAAMIVAAAGAFLIWFAPERLISRAETVQTYQEDSSAMLRLQAWSVSLNLAIERPLTGGGFKIEQLPDPVWMSYADRRLDQWGEVARSPHSVYFGLLGEHGFVGLFLGLALLVTTLVSLQQLKKQSAAANPGLRWIGGYATGLQVAVIGYAVSGAFQPLPYFDLYFTYVAIGAMLKRELKLACQGAGTTSMSAKHGVGGTGTSDKRAYEHRR